MGSIKQKRRVRFQKKQVQHYKRSILLILSIIMLSVCVLTIGGVGLHNRDMEYRQQEQELMAQLESESARTEEIKAFKEHVGTQAYTEEIAKDKLGLAYPNEIIFKPQK